jgi:hypothetical protein
MSGQEQRMARTVDDACGNGISAGATVQGFGLANAGRYATVVEVGRTRGRLLLELHLTGKRQWMWARYWRVVS